MWQNLHPLHVIIAGESLFAVEKPPAVFLKSAHCYMSLPWQHLNCAIAMTWDLPNDSPKAFNPSDIKAHFKPNWTHFIINPSISWSITDSKPGKSTKPFNIWLVHFNRQYFDLFIYLFGFVYWKGNIFHSTFSLLSPYLINNPDDAWMHLVHFERFVPLHRIPPIFFRLNLTLLCILMTFGVHGVLLEHGFFFFSNVRCALTSLTRMNEQRRWAASGSQTSQPAGERRAWGRARCCEEDLCHATPLIVTRFHFGFFSHERFIWLNQPDRWSIHFGIHAQPPVEHQWHGEKAPSSARPHYWPSSR